MLAGIETEARRTWFVRPNRSDSGHAADAAYTSVTSTIAVCHATRSRKLETRLLPRPSPIRNSPSFSSPRLPDFPTPRLPSYTHHAAPGFSVMTQRLSISTALVKPWLMPISESSCSIESGPS